MVGFRAGLFNIIARGELNILRNIHQNWAGAALGRDVERLMDGRGEVICLFDQPVHLGAGAGDANGVGFLERIRADHEGGHLTCQNHDRDRIHQGIGQACHGIGGTWPRGYKNNAGLARGARITFGGMHSTLFMAHEDVFDVVLLKNLVIDR